MYRLVSPFLFPFDPFMSTRKKRTTAEWPKSVKRGSVTVKIYRVNHPSNRNGFAYTVTYSGPQGRKQKKFANEAAAIEEATVIANRLKAGHIEGTELRKGERDEYVAAKGLLADYPLLSALEEWKRAKELCGSDLLVAAQSWAEANGSARKEIAIAQLVKDFLKDKKASGVNTKSGYARTLPRVAKAFEDTLVHTLTAPVLRNWLRTEFKQKEAETVHPSTFNSHRRRMVTLWKWGRDEGYLPKNTQTEIELVGTMKEQDLEIGILKVPEYAAILRLIHEQYPEHLATVVLAGFAGLRRSELGLQRWEDIDLKRKLLRVSKAKSNTPSKRIVHLPDSALQWLRKCQSDDELIGPAWSMDRARAVIREAGINCPENCFRHSFITYRVAKTGNVDETALEAGNSRDMIFKHYRELTAKDDGVAWFSLGPRRVTEMAESKHLRSA
jgi:integrase